MVDDKFETVVYKSKTFGKLLEEIHTNSRENDKLISGLIEDFKDAVELNGLGDVIMLAKVLEPYIKMSIDNNDHIIKMASIVQKSLEKAKSTEDSSNGSFTEEDFKELDSIRLEYEESLKLPPISKEALPDAPKKRNKAK